MRNVKHGSIQAAVRAAIAAAGGLEAASDSLALSITTLSRASEPDDDRPGGLGVNHLHRLARMVPNSAIPIAEHFAHLAGGIFQPLPTGGPLDADIARITKEFADVLQRHAEAHGPTSDTPLDYSPREARMALADIDELLSACAAMRAALAVKAGVM